MKNLLTVTAIIILCFVACTSNSLKTGQTFGDFVGIDEIDGAEIVNNSGTVSLNNQQLEKLKKELAKLTLQPNQEIKTGALGLKFTKAKQDYFLATRTNGKLAGLTMPNGKSMVFKLNGLNLDNYKNENIKETTWIDDFKSFRTAVYSNDITKLKTYFNFPFNDEGKTIFHLCELTESDWAQRKIELAHPDLFSEKDLEKYYKKIFDKRFTKALLKVKTEELFSKKTYSTATIVDDEVIYKLYTDYNDKDKTLVLNMSFGNNAKDENGEYVSEGEHNIIYQFKVINDKKLVLSRIDIAG